MRVENSSLINSRIRALALQLIMSNATQFILGPVTEQFRDVSALIVWHRTNPLGLADDYRQSATEGSNDECWPVPEN